MGVNSYSRKVFLRGAGVKNISDLYSPSVIAKRSLYNYVNMTMNVIPGEAYIETLNAPLITDATSLSHHFKHCIAIDNKFRNEGTVSNLNIPTATGSHVVVNNEYSEDFIVRRIGSI